MRLLRLTVLPSNSNSPNKDQAHIIFLIAEDYAKAIELLERDSDLYFMEKSMTILSMETIAQLHNPYTQNGLPLLISEYSDIHRYTQEPRADTEVQND